MKTVLLDCDGVLSDFIGPVLEIVNLHTDRKCFREDVTQFDFAASLDLTPIQKRLVTGVISNREGWWSSLPVLPGAQQGVARLMDVADVYIVTSPWNSCPTWLHEREAWLKRHFDIPHSRVLAGSAKHLVSGHVFVDDKTETCQRWDDEQSYMGPMPDGTVGTTFAVQWETPHNRLDGWSGCSTNSWEQLVEWCK